MTPSTVFCRHRCAHCLGIVGGLPLSESTRFLGQPNEIKPTEGAVGGELLLTYQLYGCTGECGNGGCRLRLIGEGGSAGGGKINQCRVLRDVIPPNPPGPEGSNGNGLVRAQ